MSTFQRKEFKGDFFIGKLNPRVINFQIDECPEFCIKIGAHSKKPFNLCQAQKRAVTSSRVSFGWYLIVLEGIIREFEKDTILETLTLRKTTNKTKKQN